MTARDTDWDGVRLHVVTGKGGTGKTTVAAALALALASKGDRVLLVEVEGRQGLAQLFELEPLPYFEMRLGEVCVGLNKCWVHSRGALAARNRVCEAAKRQQRGTNLVFILRGGLERGRMLVTRQCLFDPSLIAQGIAEP